MAKLVASCKNCQGMGISHFQGGKVAISHIVKGRSSHIVKIAASHIAKVTASHIVKIAAAHIAKALAFHIVKVAGSSFHIETDQHLAFST
jgi:hypothetical protein